jgi:hypothetical protein
VVGHWGAVLISVGLIISLLGALLSWVLLCAEIMFAAAKDHTMPEFLRKENANHVPVNALWLTNAMVQMFLIITLFSASTYLSLIYLATSMILVPYLWSAAYARCWRYAARPTKGRGRAPQRPDRRYRPDLRGLAAVCRRREIPAALGPALRPRRDPVRQGQAGTQTNGFHQRREADFRRRGRRRPGGGLRSLRRLPDPVSPDFVIWRITAMTTEKVKYGVHSEAGKLRKVMVCSPGLAHQRLTPNNCDELLFDDVIWVAQAKRDHFDFVTKMRERGIDVLEMHNLLTDIVAIPEALDWILERKITAEPVGLGLINEVLWLKSLEPRTSPNS